MPFTRKSPARIKRECDSTRRSDTRFEDLAELLPQIVFELDEDLRFTFFNWSAIDIIGHAYDEQADDRAGIFDIVREPDRERVRSFFTRIQQEVTSDHIECGIVAHDGREIPAIIYASPIIGEKRIAGVHGVIVDISEQVRLEKALEMTNQKLNMMNSVTRHDVLNSVTGVLGLCDMLAAMRPDGEATVLVSDIHSQVLRIKEQILFTKDYQNVGVKAPQWQALCPCIRDAAASIGRDAAGMISLPGTDAEIYADPFFGRVFYNLMDNSLRHGGSVRNIAVETEHLSDGSLVIRYRDDGCGVPLNEKQKIFEQGYGKNTGFGLFFIREVLGMTGLSIQETGTFGKGVVFEITVPKAAWRAGESAPGNQ
jgi:PAS domain S-box-containing protein